MGYKAADKLTCISLDDYFPVQLGVDDKRLNKLG